MIRLCMDMDILTGELYARIDSIDPNDFYNHICLVIKLEKTPDELSTVPMPSGIISDKMKLKLIDFLKGELPISE